MGSAESSPSWVRGRTPENVEFENVEFGAFGDLKIAPKQCSGFKNV